MGTNTIPLGRGLAAGIAAVVAAALVAVPSARPDTLPPLIELGPVVVANGTATVSGTVGGMSVLSLDVSVNGHPLAVDAAGHFAGVVSLSGQDNVDVLARNQVAGNQAELRVPLKLGLGGLIPAGTTAAVEEALRALLQPLGGVTVGNGLPVQLSGRLLNADELASVKINGTELLSQLKPDGSFTIQLPGTTKTITATVVDKRDTTGTFSTSESRGATAPTPQPTVSPTTRTVSVAAASAVGVRIAKIRYITKGAVRRHRVRMVVTVKDIRGYLVRGATVQIRTSNPKTRRVVKRQQLKRTTSAGKAQFVLRIRKRALGTRVVIVTTARTPTASARKTTSVRLPRARRAVQRSR
jgi:hypothetical protein